MGLIYYIPGRAAVDKAILAACGLEAIIEPDADSPGPSWRPMEPPGTPLDWPAGCLLGVRGSGGPAPRLLYRPEEQTWSEGGAYAVGFFNDDRPGPSELARPRQIEGHAVRIGDDDWIVPPLRVASCPGGIPNAFLEGTPLADWLVRRIDALWGRVYDRPFGARLPVEEDTNTMAALLAINYRLDPAACELLGLTTTAAGCLGVLDAALDLPRVRAMLADPTAAAILARLN